MRKWMILFVALATLSACKSKKTGTPQRTVTEQRVKKIAPDKIDEAQKQKAYDLGKRVLMTCNTSRFKPFTTEEATKDVIKNTTEERLTKTCHNFRLKYGEFKDIRFIELMRDNRNKLNIYRFKADYSKKIANKELRVTINEDNLVSSIKTLDWQDEFK